jgi:REP element-mobilizing transposase RayT
MPNSFTQNFYHAVFSTKHREPLIGEEIEPRLHAYMQSMLESMGCRVIALNGMAEHVHVLVEYPSSLSHAAMMSKLKASSSGWVSDTFPAAKGFGWQDGYGGFSVSHAIVPAVKAYIDNQKQHHRTVSFKEEMQSFIDRVQGRRPDAA